MQIQSKMYNSDYADIVKLGGFGGLVAISIVATIFISGCFNNPLVSFKYSDASIVWAKSPSDIVDEKYSIKHKQEHQVKDLHIDNENIEEVSDANVYEADNLTQYEPLEYFEPSEYHTYSNSYNGVSGDPNGLNSFVGVVEWNGTTETAYSSNVLYHYRTSEWTPDEYGFYRTDEGYYVVGSEDYEQGTLIETSRGTAIVSDCGGDPGIVDFYVNW